MNRICVYCGSNKGARPEYLEAARRLGRTLAEKRISLVYGGGRVGMMGEIARASLDHGGEVIGVTPSIFIDMKVIQDGLSELHVVDSMHERKAMMADLSDAFITLPGGFGTLDELFEIITWSQLEIHHKPCGLLNICGYFSKLLQFLEHSVEERFLNRQHFEMLLVEDEAEPLIERLRNYQPVQCSKILDHE